MARALGNTAAWIGSALCVLGAAGTARAEDPKPAVKPAPVVASDEEATAAVEKFKTDFKAKGLQGEDKTSQRDFAMAQMSKVQHRLVVEQLAGVTRNPDATLKTLAVIYLGDQRAVPGAAGAAVAAAMEKAGDDFVLSISGAQSLGSLQYLGARETIRSLLKHTNYALKKSGIAAIGEIRDMRMLGDVIAVIGLTYSADGKEGGGPEVVGEGTSWEGASASVDTGSSGDGDQKAAEAAAKAKIAANKAAATGAGGASSGDEGGGGLGGGGAKRTPRELIPVVLDTLRKLTGEAFPNPAAVKTWIKEHAASIAEQCKALDAAEKDQAAKAKK